jgi:hypothetical protein
MNNTIKNEEKPKLIPCPFCGAEVKVIREDETSYIGVTIPVLGSSNYECHVSPEIWCMKKISQDDLSLEEAIEFWNNSLSKFKQTA